MRPTRGSVWNSKVTLPPTGTVCGGPEEGRNQGVKETMKGLDTLKGIADDASSAK